MARDAQYLANNDPRDTIQNTFFWPEIRLSEYQIEMRSNDTLPRELLRQLLLTAIAEVNAELFAYREDLMASGIKSLNDVPADRFDGESELVWFYRLAVFCWTKASLHSHRTKSLPTEEPMPGQNILWRDLRWALSCLQDMPHMTTEFIS